MPKEPRDQDNNVPLPLTSQPGNAVRQKLMEQGICEEDIATAVAWARDHSDDQS